MMVARRPVGQRTALVREFSVNKVGIVSISVLTISTLSARAQTPAKPEPTPVSTTTTSFDPRDLSGVWRLPMKGPKTSLLFRSTEPEPPLTDWGQQHMFPGGITHGAHPVPSGHFAGENCEPIAVPAQFAYLRFYPFENIQTPDRIHQVFELHREWRDIWIGAEHPKDLSPTYMGDSIGHWDGNTLVVDTVGYNGKDWITEDVGHPMSNQFHLVERYTRLDHDTLKLEMTFYDPKNWGDKPWGGFTRVLKLQSDHLQEWICVPEVDEKFNEKIMKPTYGSEHLNLPKDSPKQ